jgi:hypothetical protein
MTVIDPLIDVLTIDPIDPARSGVTRSWPRTAGHEDSDAVGGWTSDGVTVVFHHEDVPINRLATRLWHRLNPVAGVDLQGRLIITKIGKAGIPTEVVQMWRSAK